jgi:hypothetical protein
MQTIRLLPRQVATGVSSCRLTKPGKIMEKFHRSHWHDHIPAILLYNRIMWSHVDASASVCAHSLMFIPLSNW